MPAPRNNVAFMKAFLQGELAVGQRCNSLSVTSLDDAMVLMSYATPIAFIEGDRLWVSKETYSVTTAKQITQLAGQCADTGWTMSAGKTTFGDIVQNRCSAWGRARAGYVFRGVRRRSNG